MGECGAAEAVVFALRRHESCVKIAYKTCYAIHYLALIANNSSWIRANGGCKVYGTVQYRELYFSYLNLLL